MVLISPAARESRTEIRTEAIVALVTEDVYSVMTERETLGFVQRVGTVYVALSGDILSHAVEVGQSLSLDRAVRMVRVS
ncbi:MAG TPA: hypothetical protein VIJ11_12860 [Galbitalea sp.]|jgi:hypothetical protein